MTSRMWTELEKRFDGPSASLPPPSSNMQPVKLSFGIKKTGLAKPAAKKATAFVFAAADDDDEPAPSTSKLASTNSNKSSQPRVSTASLSKAQKAKQAGELLLDRTVYEYDEVYDNMKEGSRQAELEKKKDAGDRKVSSRATERRLAARANLGSSPTAQVHLTVDGDV